MLSCLYKSYQFITTDSLRHLTYLKVGMVAECELLYIYMMKSIKT